MGCGETRVMQRLLIFAVAFLLFGAAAPPAATSPRAVRVVMDDDYALYSFRSRAHFDFTPPYAATEAPIFFRTDEKWFGSTIDAYGRYFGYAGSEAVAALLLIAGLFAWNRALSRKV